MVYLSIKVYDGQVYATDCCVIPDVNLHDMYSL